MSKSIGSDTFHFSMARDLACYSTLTRFSATKSIGDTICRPGGGALLLTERCIPVENHVPCGVSREPAWIARPMQRRAPRQSLTTRSFGGDGADAIGAGVEIDHAFNNRCVQAVRLAPNSRRKSLRRPGSGSGHLRTHALQRIAFYSMISSARCRGSWA